MTETETVPAWDEAADADLVRAIAAVAPGEARSAEEALYRRLAPRARLYGLRHLRDEAAAQDLAQQVLVMTIEGVRGGRVRDPERLASFVLGACRTIVADIRRGTVRRRRLLDLYEGDAPRPEPYRLPDLDRDRLRECLEGLPARERTVVVMSFYDEREGTEVAARLGLAAGNVRVIRHRALARLRECLGGEGEAP